MGLTMNGFRRFFGWSLRETEHSSIYFVEPILQILHTMLVLHGEVYRPRFIEPVGQCSALILGLDSKILLVSYRNVGCGRAKNVLTVHENRHQRLLAKDQDAKSTSWCRA